GGRRWSRRGSGLRAGLGPRLDWGLGTPRRRRRQGLRFTRRGRRKLVAAAERARRNRCWWNGAGQRLRGGGREDQRARERAENKAAVTASGPHPAISAGASWRIASATAVAGPRSCAKIQAPSATHSAPAAARGSASSMPPA